MKIAICFSGLSRTFEYCWPSYSSLLSKYDCDLFVASTPNNIFHNYPFKKILYQQDEIMLDPWYNLNHLPKSPGQSMLRQFYFIELANKLRTDYEQDKNIKYDFVIRTRTDNLILGELPNLEECDPEKIYIPEGHDHPECTPGLGISDRFAFSGSRIMTIYSEKIKFLPEYMSDLNHWYFAEVILKWILDKNQIPIVRFADQVKVMRENKDLV